MGSPTCRSRTLDSVLFRVGVGGREDYGAHAASHHIARRTSERGERKSLTKCGSGGKLDELRISICVRHGVVVVGRAPSVNEC